MKNSILFAIFVVFISFETATTFTIDCNYGIYSYYVIGNVYMCETANIPTSSGNRVAAVTGQHLCGKTNDDVEYVVILGNWTLSFVPQGLIDVFPNIKGIQIEQSIFETLYGDEFKEIPALKWLTIRQTFLTTISSRLFMYTPNLVYISVNANPLQRVGRDLFTPLNLSQLIWVNFLDNRCISDGVPDGNQTAINSIINQLRLKCPFDDEV